MASRGYGREHWLLRKRVAVEVARGGVRCWRCGRMIPPGSPWDLGHHDQDRSVYMGPEHRACNRATSRHRVQRQRRKRWSRVW